MKAEVRPLRKLLDHDGQYIIPVFQRTYSWGQEQWENLWNDILDLHDKNKELPEKDKFEHFMGSVVTFSLDRGNKTLQLVDGQQRITTLHILLFALRDLALKTHPELAGRLKRYIENEYPRSPKLVPGEADKAVYESLWNSKQPQGTAHAMERAYGFFHKNLKKHAEQLESIFDVVINCISIIWVKLEERDDPYSVFESLNAKGLELSVADLVHNLLFMYVPQQQHEQLNRDYWEPLYRLLVIETPGKSTNKDDNLLSLLGLVSQSQSGKSTKKNHNPAKVLTEFMRHFYNYHTGRYVSDSYLYTDFKNNIVLQCKQEHGSTEPLFQELYKAAKDYKKFLNPETEPVAKIRQALRNLNLIDSKLIYPLLLSLFRDYREGTLPEDELVECLTLLENYHVRLFLATGRISKQSDNKEFPGLYATLMKEPEDERSRPQRLAEVFSKHVNSRLSDMDLRAKGHLRAVYTGNKKGPAGVLKLILYRIEKHLSDNREVVSLENCTIEHIAPQKITDEWKQEWGVSNVENYKEWLHTLGNLTLVDAGRNAKMSNHPYSDKLKEFSASNFMLNRKLAEKYPRWNAECVEERGRELIEMAIRLWPGFGPGMYRARATGSKPEKMKLLGQEYDVNTWKGVLTTVLEAIIKQVPEDTFVQQIARANPNYFASQSSNDLRSPHKLGNGWFTETNFSAQDIQKHARRYLQAVGLDVNSFDVEVK